MDEDFLAQLPKKRKRGGLAGIYDRNKKIIKPVVSGALGLINPALGAAAGAAMGGLDREGKRGVGLDLGGAVRGGIAGYGAGAAASALKGGVQGAMGATGLDRISAFGSGAKAGGQEYLNKPLLGRQASPVTNMADAPLGGASNAGAFKSAVPLPDASFASSVAGPVSPSEPRGLMRGLSRVGQFVEKNAAASGMGLQALSSILGSQSERRLREREQAEERRRAENLAMYALPMYRGMR